MNRAFSAEGADNTRGARTQALHNSLAPARSDGTPHGAPSPLPYSQGPKPAAQLNRSLHSSPSKGKWVRAFLGQDPRRQLVEYFKPGDQRGPYGYLRAQGLRPNGPPSTHFAVWRPTSVTAMRMLFEIRESKHSMALWEILIFLWSITMYANLKVVMYLLCTSLAQY